MSPEFSSTFDRRRIGWWLVAIALAGVVGFFMISFVGTFIFGLFVYYGARPVNRQIRRHVDSRGVAATITLLCIVLPTLTLLGYTGFVAVREFTATIGPETMSLLLERLPGNQQTLAVAFQNFPQLVRQVGQLSEVNGDSQLRWGYLVLSQPDCFT